MKHFLIFITALVLICAIVLSACSSEKAVETEKAQKEETTEMQTEPVANSTVEGLKTTFIDVGKGDCILIEIDDKKILMDAGYAETSSGVITYLKNQGVARLDYVIITHYDKDHVGGAADIVKAFDVGQVYLPDYEGLSKYYTAFKNTVSQLGLNSTLVSEETSFSISDAVFTLYPSGVKYLRAGGNEEGNDNDMSIVMSVIYGKDTYMFAGDLEEEGVDKYLEAKHGQFAVLKVPHHGVKEGNTDDLLDEVKPEIAVITDGDGEEADKKVIKELTKLGATIYQSSANGTIVITSNGTGEYEVTTQK